MPGRMLLLILKLSNLFAGLLMQSAKIKYNWYKGAIASKACGIKECLAGMRP